jgi:virginiamycin B lyase
VKKQVKGYLAFAFLGGIMLTSGVLVAMTGYDPDVDYAAMDDPEVTITGTPADIFSDDQRAVFCSSGGAAKSTDYVNEYMISTDCTGPVAIVSDYDGDVWFAQANTGSLGKFDPDTETFIQFPNTNWMMGDRSMIRGIDYAPDGSVWFTDDFKKLIWKFSTINEEYNALEFPTDGDSLPQKLSIEGSQIIVNDFLGNKLTIFDVNSDDSQASAVSIPSSVDGAFTGQFTLDTNDHIWYTNWMINEGGILINYNHEDYRNDVLNSGEQFLPMKDYVITYTLPPQLIIPNGIAFSDDDTLWISDSGTSSFFSFESSTGQFIQYVTADPIFETYGNQTGIIKNPISRPYSMESDDQGRIIFNEQTGNNISVMDPRIQSLVEYHIPSKNPNWADCNSGTKVMENCGVAQILDFTISGEKIWFTEWVENKIGVVDTSIPLPLEIQLEQNTLNLVPGESQEFQYIISVGSQNNNLDLSLVTSGTHDFLTVNVLDNSANLVAIVDDPREPITITTMISASDNALSGTYKILLGVQSDDVTISKFLTVIIE